jgi:hypothetical protein
MKFPLFLLPIVLVAGCANRFSAGGVDDSAVVDAFLSNASAPLKPLHQSYKPPVQVSSPRTLVQLEAEELRIRNDASLTRTERMQKLREIWRQQLVVMGR